MAVTLDVHCQIKNESTQIFQKATDIILKSKSTFMSNMIYMLHIRPQ